MGAESFTSLGHGKTLEQAFRQARDDAQHESGHGGYTGTIAEKPSASLIRAEPKSLEEAYRFVRDLEADGVEWDEGTNAPAYKTEQGVRYGEAYNDKWGPALALEIDRASLPETVKLATGSRAWLFFGLASS